jgi:hypothetical protein
MPASIFHVGAERFLQCPSTPSSASSARGGLAQEKTPADASRADRLNQFKYLLYIVVLE